MAANRSWADRGIRSMTPDKSLQALTRILDADVPQIAVLAVDWQSRAGHPSSLYLELSERAHPRQPVAAASQFLATLDASSPHERRRMLEDYAARQALKVLGLSFSHRLNPKQPLQELGLDSLMAVELRNAIGRGLARSLPATLLFDYPTLESLSRFLAGEAQTLPSAEEEHLARVADVEQLSEQDAERLLQERLEKL
jgi:acyl carrier protein